MRDVQGWQIACPIVNKNFTNLIFNHLHPLYTVFLPAIMDELIPENFPITCRACLCRNTDEMHSLADEDTRNLFILCSGYEVPS